MKYNNILKSLYLGLAIIVVGCSDDLGYDNSMYVASEKSSINMEVSKSDLTFEADGNNTERIDIKSDVSWNFNGLPEWVHTSVLSGNGNGSADFTADKYSNVRTRNAVFPLTFDTSIGDFTNNIIVTQTGVKPYLEWLTEEDITTDFRAKTIDLKISTNCDKVTAQCSNSDYSLSFKENYSVLTVAIPENVTEEIVHISIYLTGEVKIDDSHTVELKSSGTVINQTPPGVVVDESKLEFPVYGGTKTFDMECDVDWRIGCEAYNDHVMEVPPSWVTISPLSGKAGKQKIEVSLVANNSSKDRRADIYISNSYGRTLYTKYIYQKGHEITLENSALSFTYNDEGRKEIKFISTADWEVTMRPDWIATLSPSEGNGSDAVQSILVEVEQSSSVNERSGIIRIENVSMGLYKDIIVTQEGIPFGVGSNSIYFPWVGGTQSLLITIPGTWEAKSNVGWISLSEMFGEGETRVEVNASRNDDDNARQGTISINTEDKTITVAVVQEGQYIKIDNASGIVDAIGGSVELSVSSTVGMKSDLEYDGKFKDWVKESSTSKTNEDGSVTTTTILTAEYNPSANDRKCTYVLIPTSEGVSETTAQGVKYYLTQKGRQLSTDVSEIAMFMSGGSSDTYKVTAEGEYTITKDPSAFWFTLSTDMKNNRFAVTVNPNETGTDREGYVIVSLTNLPEGETKEIRVKVIQYGKTNISGEGFGEDEDWN